MKVYLPSMKVFLHTAPWSLIGITEWTSEGFHHYRMLAAAGTPEFNRGLNSWHTSKSSSLGSSASPCALCPECWVPVLAACWVFAEYCHRASLSLSASCSLVAVWKSGARMINPRRRLQLWDGGRGRARNTMQVSIPRAKKSCHELQLL